MAWVAWCPISFHIPSPENPLGNPAYPGATSSNGPNYVDFLTTTYNQSFIQTFNLGYGGATIDPSLIGSPYGYIVQSFRQQVQDEFLPTYATNPGVAWSGSNSLFTVFFGINDVVLSYGQRNSTLNFLLIKSYENLVHQLYAAGARNFLFMNVPPIDRSPGMLARDAASQASMAGYIGEFNFRLILLVYNLAVHYPDTTVWLFDTNWLFTRLLNNGAASFRETANYVDLTDYCAAYQQQNQVKLYYWKYIRPLLEQGVRKTTDTRPSTELKSISAFRALQNPGLFKYEHYRQAAIAIVAVKVSLWTLSFFINSETSTWDDQLVGGLDFIANSVLQVPFFLMSLMRYITPTLDHMCEFSKLMEGLILTAVVMDSLQWVDQTYIQKHQREDQKSLRALFYPNLRLYDTHGDTSKQKAPMDAAIAFLTRFGRRAAISLAIYMLSYLPIVGRFVLPAASFYTFNKAVGPVPATIIFGSGIFLPRRYLVMFLQSYFSSRSLMRELITDPPPPPAYSERFAESQVRWKNKHEFLKLPLANLDEDNIQSDKKEQNRARMGDLPGKKFS
ncbi:MAG: hypothetical protein Q9208_001728 [Pyrenodesmia sp. 3 TL-2023]